MRAFARFLFYLERGLVGLIRASREKDNARFVALWYAAIADLVVALMALEDWKKEG